MKNNEKQNHNTINTKPLRHIIENALQKAQNGEAFLEKKQNQAFTLNDGKLNLATANTTEGFGLRAINEDAVIYANASEINEENIKNAAQIIQQNIPKINKKTQITLKRNDNHIHKLYENENPVENTSIKQKIQILNDIETYAKKYNPKVKHVSVNLFCEKQNIEIIKKDGNTIKDQRPLIRLGLSVIAQDKNKKENGFYGGGTRDKTHNILKPENWKAYIQNAVEQAITNLNAQEAPAGEMTVILGPGWPGILLHEAIGHGLEGDGIYKKTSAFAQLKGEYIAAKNVTVIDDGTLYGRRGSISVDDEGTPSKQNVLIENGKLVNFMHDIQSAKMLNETPSGNGRRQNYQYPPMPRMTNTFMVKGDKDPKEIIESVKRGLYAVSFGGGQVDTTSGKFVFSCTQAFIIENGKIKQPVKGAMIIGNGPDALKKISMVGNDLKLDPGIGTCGKNGQWVPVGVGQPTIRIDNITVGGAKI